MPVWLQEGALATGRARCKLWFSLGPLPVIIATVKRPRGKTKNCPEASGIYCQPKEQPTPPPPPAHARPCLSTGWALNRRFEEIVGTAVFVVQNGGLGVCRAFVQGKRGSFMSVMVHSVHNNIVLHIAIPCCLF